MTTFLVFVLGLTTVLADPVLTAVREEGGIFSYVRGIGPADWGTIKGVETCGTGASQSPIDLPATAMLKPISEGPMPMFNKTTLLFERTTDNFELKCEKVGECGFTEFDGKKFNLINLHFHSPSEHKLAGEQFPLEAHMVHRSEDGEVAVISTLFRYPAYLRRLEEADTVGSNAVFNKILKQIEDDEEDIFVDLPGLIGKKGYVFYSGSFTTPPCTEGVSWFVAQTVQTISEDEVAQYVDIAESTVFGNNRPIQPLNGRMLAGFVL